MIAMVLIFTVSTSRVASLSIFSFLAFFWKTNIIKFIFTLAKLFKFLLYQFATDIFNIINVITTLHKSLICLLLKIKIPTKTNWLRYVCILKTHIKCLFWIQKSKLRKIISMTTLNNINHQTEGQYLNTHNYNYIILVYVPWRII